MGGRGKGYWKGGGGKVEWDREGREGKVGGVGERGEGEGKRGWGSSYYKYFNTFDI